MILIYEFTSLLVSFVYLYKFTISYSVNSYLIFVIYFFAYKEINLYLCKANEEGRFRGFSKCTWEAGAFFSSAPRSQSSLGRLAQGQYRDIIKAGSIKFHFLE